MTLTGVAEVLGAVGMVIPPSSGVSARAASALALAALMVIMFPANVYAAVARRHPASARTGLTLRTVMQVVFVGSAVAAAIYS